MDYLTDPTLYTGTSLSSAPATEPTTPRKNATVSHGVTHRNDVGRHRIWLDSDTQHLLGLAIPTGTGAEEADPESENGGGPPKVSFTIEIGASGHVQEVGNVSEEAAAARASGKTKLDSGLRKLSSVKSFEINAKTTEVQQHREEIGVDHAVRSEVDGRACLYFSSKEQCRRAAAWFKHHKQAQLVEHVAAGCDYSACEEARLAGNGKGEDEAGRERKG